MRTIVWMLLLNLIHWPYTIGVAWLHEWIEWYAFWSPSWTFTSCFDLIMHIPSKLIICRLAWWTFTTLFTAWDWILLDEWIAAWQSLTSTLVDYDQFYGRLDSLECIEECYEWITAWHPLESTRLDWFVWIDLFELIWMDCSSATSYIHLDDSVLCETVLAWWFSWSKNDAFDDRWNKLR